MTTRRRRILGLLLGLGALLLAAGWFGARDGRAEVKIVFLGFTNDPITIPDGGKSGGPLVCTQTVGRVAMTNTGSVSVRAADFRWEHFTSFELTTSGLQKGGGGSSGPRLAPRIEAG